MGVDIQRLQAQGQMSQRIVVSSAMPSKVMDHMLALWYGRRFVYGTALTLLSAGVRRN